MTENKDPLDDVTLQGEGGGFDFSAKTDFLCSEKGRGFENVLSLTTNILETMSFLLVFLAICDFIEMGMHTPIIHKNHGNTKSATCNPFQVACLKERCFFINKIVL